MIWDHNFSVGFQNIQGMHGGMGCKVNEIKAGLTNDIEILAETWGCNCDISFENYIPHHVSPQKHHGEEREEIRRFSYLNQKIFIKKCQIFEDIK